MANTKHMDIIKRGVEYWNIWRVNNSHVLPSLSEAGLHMAYLNRANLSRADLSDAGLRLAEMIEVNLVGADLYWANLSEANLLSANLKEANLQGANMAGSNLRETRLISANLSQANLSRADMRYAEMYRANLQNADLSGADLANADLKGANLVGVNLTGANLDGADLNDAVVGSTIFGNVDLSNVRGLETLLHLGPSTIGIDTVYKSNGRVPRTFLKNGGVEQSIMDFIEMFVDRNSKYYSCYIRYSESDWEFALKLYEDLMEHGVRCWLSTEKLKQRNRMYKVTDAAVDIHEKMIMIISENSIDSEWTENEYDRTVEKEKQTGKTVLVPITLDGSVKITEQPWAINMKQTRYAADFSMWRDEESYQEMLSCVLDELSTEEESLDDFNDFPEDEFSADEDFSVGTYDIDLNNLDPKYQVTYRDSAEDRMAY